MTNDLRPEFIRSIDAKGRLLIPACLARDFGRRARVVLERPGVLRLEPAPTGRAVERVSKARPTWLSSRVRVPMEFREAARIWPGMQVGIATRGEALLVWALEEVARVRS